MDTYLDLQTTTQTDLNADSNSTIFPLVNIKSAINRAYLRCGALFRWPQTEDAKKTSSVSGQEYYDYPSNWRPNSVRKLKVDGTDYGDPIAFKDYLYEQENNYPTGLTTMWANQFTRYFIYPTPSTNGSSNIEIWGQKVVSTLTYDDDVTIFSYNMPECNDAIVLEAEYILKMGVEGLKETSISKVGDLRNADALSILTTAWNKIRQELNKYEKTQPFFSVPDFFPDRKPGGNTSNGSPIGDF